MFITLKHPSNNSTLPPFWSITIRAESRTTEPVLHIRSHPLLHSSNLLFIGIKSNTDLIKRIIRTLLEFFPTQLDPLLSTQSLALAAFLELFQSPRLESAIGRFEPSLRVSVDLEFVGGGIGERECVESVVDSARVEGRGSLRWGGRLIQLPQVQAPSFLNSGL